MSAGRRGVLARWSVVAVLVAVLGSLPVLIGALPASDAAISAADLRARVLASARTPFSGYAESAGGLSLPVTDQLTSVADLFSDRTTMRVWWRTPTDNRVDVVTATGETDTHTGTTGSWTWSYERATATRVDATPLALPAPPDLLPTALGRRLLSEATSDELSRIGARRVAGRDALGIRVIPSQSAASVGRVDVWVDRASGLPLQVQVVGTKGNLTALDTRFLDLDLATPSVATTAFVIPPGAAARVGQQAEIVLEAGRRIAPVPLPDSLLGLPRRRMDGVPGAIGIYGRGVTVLTVTPVPERLAVGLHDSLVQSPDAVVDAKGVRVAAGPVGLMVVQPAGGGPYVLTGTVTLDALATAATRLPGLEGSR
jgi:outer membrane lipoprotein-sorting protein